MKKNIYKIIQTIGFILVASALITAGYIGLIINNAVHTNSIAIIGGADKPTAQFLVSQLAAQYKWAILLILALLIAGVCCITASVFMNKRYRETLLR